MKNTIDKGNAGRSLFGMFMAYSFGQISTIFPHTATSKPSKLFKTVKAHHPHQSEKEKARRRTQLANGILKRG